MKSSEKEEKLIILGAIDNTELFWRTDFRLVIPYVAGHSHAIENWIKKVKLKERDYLGYRKYLFKNDYMTPIGISEEGVVRFIDYKVEQTNEFEEYNNCLYRQKKIELCVEQFEKWNGWVGDDTRNLSGETIYQLRKIEGKKGEVFEGRLYSFECHYPSDWWR